MSKIVPLISSGTVGPLGVLHLPRLWQKVSLANPVLYLVSGFRWSFYEMSDVSITISLSMIIIFCIMNLSTIAYIFSKGYKIKF